MRALPRARNRLASPTVSIQIRVRICADADAAHADSRRAYGHTFCEKAPENGICVSSSFFDLSHGHRDGILAHEIGHLLAGQSAGEEAADRAFEEATGVRIQYRDGPHGRCLQWLPAADRQRLIGVFDFKFSGKCKDIDEPDSDDVRFFARPTDGERVELATLREAEQFAADDEDADVWAQEGRRRLAWRPLVRNPKHPRGALVPLDVQLRDGVDKHGRPLMNPTQLTMICAWCKAHMGGPKTPPPGAKASHGICRACLDRELASDSEVAATHENPSSSEDGLVWIQDGRLRRLVRVVDERADEILVEGPSGALLEWVPKSALVLKNPPRRSPDAWKTPPPCDVAATGRPLTRALARKLEGQPVRVHLNLHNGCYVFTHRGRVTAYARFFYLTDVLPRVGVGGFRRCHQKKVRNVHAYLEGTFVDGEPPATRGRGWRQITYNCKTNQRPCFFYVDNDECFEGAAEVRAWRVDNGDGTERCEVWVRGDPPEHRKNPPECACELPGGACVCGAVDAECAKVVLCGT